MPGPWLQERLGLTEGGVLSVTDMAVAALEGRCATSENSTMVAAELLAVADTFTGTLDEELWTSVWRQVGHRAAAGELCLGSNVIAPGF